LVYIEYNNHDLGKANERITELEILLEAALREIERLKETIARLEKNSGNSSKPPSSDIVKPPKVRQRKGKRKIGAQKGHKQHLRKPFEESHIDTTINLTLEACPKCGGALQAARGEAKKHQQVELVEKPFVVTEYRQHRYWCAACECYHESKLPTEVKRAGLFGSKLIALTAYLKSRCHMSYQTMQHFYADAFSLEVSTGFLAKQVGKVSAALQGPAGIEYPTTIWCSTCRRRAISMLMKRAARSMASSAGHGVFGGKTLRYFILMCFETVGF
jgi:transposase